MSKDAGMDVTHSEGVESFDRSSYGDANKCKEGVDNEGTTVRCGRRHPNMLQRQEMQYVDGILRNKSYDANESSFLEDTTATLKKFERNIKILYSIISIFSILVIFCLWSLRQEFDEIRTTCSLHTNADRYYVNVEELNVIDQVIGDVKRTSERVKRNVHYNKRPRIEKRSDVTSTLHEYCRTVYDLCDQRPPAGPPGVPVTQGPPGPPGPMGPKGELGHKGEKGAPGRFGFDGIAGSPGAKGEPGLKGERGLVGFTGDKGDMGYPGPKGSQGDYGMKGDKGTVGEPGPRGPDGPKGDPGPIGRNGPPGDKGPEGPKGEKGFDGIPGVPGFKGYKGDAGDRGPRGYGLNCVCEKGEKGDKGVRGLVGFDGYKGERGEQGPVGPQGVGVKGDEGPMGRRGVKGEPGQKGDCDVLTKEKQNFRVVNVDRLGQETQIDRTLNEVPQQDYRAPRQDTSGTHNSGARGSRSSGLDLDNLASTTIASCAPCLSVVLAHWIKIIFITH